MRKTPLSNLNIGDVYDTNEGGSVTVINALFSISGKTLSKLPMGVRHSGKQYMTIMSKKYIGTYRTIEEASLAYREAKQLHILEIAEEWVDYIAPEVYYALIGLVDRYD